MARDWQIEQGNIMIMIDGWIIDRSHSSRDEFFCPDERNQLGQNKRYVYLLFLE
mgnify:CR=1 FL=1